MEEVGKEVLKAAVVLALVFVGIQYVFGIASAAAVRARSSLNGMEAFIG